MRTATPRAKPSLVPAGDDALEPLAPQPVNAGDAPAARVAPVGAVYTTRQTRVTDDRYLVTVCVANIGIASVPEVNVAFALLQPDATIMSLRAPSAPSEVSGNRARAIIRDIPPGRQVQVDVVIQVQALLRDGQPEVAVPEAYRLTPADPALVCAPRDAAFDPSESVEARFIIANETVEADQVAAALSARLESFSTATVDQGFQAAPFEAGLSTTALGTLLIASGALAFVLAILFFIRRRGRSVGSQVGSSG